MDFFRTKRMVVSLLCGAILGLVCIAGAFLRSGGTVGAQFLFALWFNRLMMGMVVGSIQEETGRSGLILRGALIGLVISFAFYSAAGFGDVVSFLAGIAYGIILEMVAHKYGA